MEKLAENDLTYFYLRHVVVVITAVTTISLPPVAFGIFKLFLNTIIYHFFYISKQNLLITTAWRI
jgi:hypothetical protein